MDQTDIDLDSGRVAFGVKEPRTIDPAEIVEKGIAGTVTVDLMVLQIRGRPIENEEGWSLRVWKTGQLIPLAEAPPSEFGSIEQDVPVQVELSGWREGEKLSGQDLKRLGIATTPGQRR